MGWIKLKTISRYCPFNDFFLHRDHGLNLFELLFKTYPEWRQKYFFQFGDDPMEELKKQPKVILQIFKCNFFEKDDILNLP
jgi:hypothetical protein